MNKLLLLMVLFASCKGKPSYNYRALDTRTTNIEIVSSPYSLYINGDIVTVNNKGMIVRKNMSSGIQKEVMILNIVDTVRNMRAYQISLEDDSITLYDSNRYVGTVGYVNHGLDSLILKDNE